MQTLWAATRWPSAEGVFTRLDASAKVDAGQYKGHAMATPEQRLAALEEEVAQLKATLPWETPQQQLGDESRGARLIREARESRAQVAAGWRKFMNDLGINGQPIGAKKLRAMLIEAGIDPETNEFSREIIAMREE
jgi:hypothetical protein